MSKTLPKLLLDVLKNAIRAEASDIHLATGESVHIRVDGQIQKLDGFSEFDSEQAAQILQSLLSAGQINSFENDGSFDGAFSLDEHRFRFNVFRRSGETVFAIRFLPQDIPDLETLGLGNGLYGVSDLKDGLILIAGPTGSGKSTTIAAFLDRINQTRSTHIITIEDPIEFLHPSQKSLVNQRQIGSDFATFAEALRDALRQDPDVILVGELRDLDTIRTAITAAETGHLVFATVHAGDCKTAIERLIGAFPSDEQNLAQRLVATVLRTVIVQHLLPKYQSPNLESTAGSQRVLASEVVQVNSAVSNLIANAELNQIASIVQVSADDSMWTLDDSLARLWRQRLISEQTARSLARDPSVMAQLKRAGRA